MSKTILITGSTDGIGKLAALKLAREDHKIYLHGRNPEKLADVIAEIKEESDNQSILGFVADFSDNAAVKKMTAQIKEEVAALDVLINNAGVFKSGTAQNSAGLDMRMVVNYLSPFVLTHELMPVLKQANAPRVVNVSSAAQSPVSTEVLTGRQRASVNATYAQSKLALVMWSFHLAEKEPGISVIAVNPGSLLNTKMVQEAYGKYWSSADKGATILHDLAVSNEYESISGKYFDNDKGAFGRAHADAYNNTKIDKLITATDKLVAG